jgi:hypothetical protein
MKLGFIVRRQCIQQAQWAAEFVRFDPTEQWSQEQICTPSRSKLEHHIVRRQAAWGYQPDNDLCSIDFFSQLPFCVDTDRQPVAVNAAAPNLVGGETQRSLQ